MHAEYPRFESRNVKNESCWKDLTTILFLGTGLASECVLESGNSRIQQKVVKLREYESYLWWKWKRPTLLFIV